MVTLSPSPGRGRGKVPVPQQRARMAELDALRSARALTPAESAEADSLTDRLYHRERRAKLAEMWAGTRRAPPARQREF